MSALQEQVLGRWTLVNWRQEYDDGRIQYPFGEDAVGVIHYSASGHMYCAISRARRANFVSGGQWTASEAERASAYDGYLTYTGTFSIKPGMVSHHVELAIYPNWVGSVQNRAFAFCDGELHLTARLEEGTAEARTALLHWRRESGRGVQ